MLKTWRYYHGLDSPLHDAVVVAMMTIEAIAAFVLLAPPTLWLLRATVGPWWRFWLQ